MTAAERKRGPYTWQSNQALDLLEQLECRDRKAATLLYVTLTHMASRAHDGMHDGFVATGGDVERASGMHRATVSAARDSLVSLGLLRVNRVRQNLMQWALLDGDAEAVESNNAPVAPLEHALEIMFEPNGQVMVEPASQPNDQLMGEPASLAGERKPEVQRQELPPTSRAKTNLQTPPVRSPLKVVKTRETQEAALRAHALSVTYKGRAVPKPLAVRAGRMVAWYNHLTGQHRQWFTPNGEVTEDYKRALGAAINHPEVTDEQWQRVLRGVLANPWWDGPPTIGVVFGPSVVDDNLEAPTRGAARKRKTQVGDLLDHDLELMMNGAA